MTPYRKNMRQRLALLARLLLTPTWKMRIRQQLFRAELEYDAALNAHFEALEDAAPSLHKRDQASYWRGRVDALRVFLPNEEFHNSDEI